MLAIIAGALSSLAFAPFFLAPVLVLTLPVLFVLTRTGRTLRFGETGVGAALRAAGVGWLFGFGFHLVGLHWVGHAFLVQADVFAWALPFAVTLMPAGLALFVAAAMAIARLVPASRVHPVATFAIALAVAEYLRGTILTGFPWNTIGYALTWPDPLMQSASVFGIYGLTLIVVLLAVAPWSVLGRRLTTHSALRALGVLAIPLAALWAFGAARLAGEPLTAGSNVPGIVVRLVQPSIDQTDKWRPELQRDIFDRHIALSRLGPNGAVGFGSVTHLIWAEAAMPFRPLESAVALGELSDLIPEGVTLISGILRRDPQTAQAFNSAAAFASDASLTALYDKVHLVPFGEYLPFPTLLDAIGFETLVRERGGFASGPGPRRTMAVPGLPPVEMLICYEAIFPHEVGRTEERPGLLLNLTNDGWFGTFSGPYQHFHQTRVRSVEQGVPLIRVSNNGISAVVDAHGRVLARLDLNAIGTLDHALPAATSAPPVYAVHGERIFAALLLTVLAGGLLLRRKSRPRGMTATAQP
ncbi:MAG: apolipoprotein N-acyltransferase [Hyphomicrobiaceae bacterium]